MPEFGGAGFGDSNVGAATSPTEPGWCGFFFYYYFNFFLFFFIQTQLLAERSQGVVEEYKHHPSAGLEGSLHSPTPSFPRILG